MIETGDVVDIRFQDGPRHKKPVGIYWLQSAAASLVGGADAPIWAYRIPSLLGAIAAVLLTYWVAIPLVGAKSAFWAAALFSAAILLGAEARLAKTDAVLLASILAAQGVLARLFAAVQKAKGGGPVASLPVWQPMLFWVALAIGVLVKGPIIAMVVGLTVAGVCLLERSISWLKALRPLPGILLFLVIAVPWFVLIWIRTDGAFFNASLSADLLDKVGEGQEGHGAPPLTYLALLWLTFWPASIALVVALPGIWRARWTTAVRFLAIWVLPSWIVFEIVATKLPHYVLPLYPALAILAARLGMPAPDEQIGIVRRIVLGLLLLAPVGVAGVIWFLTLRFGGPSWESIALGVLASAALLLCVAGAWRAMTASLWKRSYTFTIGAAICLAWLVYPLLARIDGLWPSQSIAAIVAESAVCETPRLYSFGYSEPSLVFLTETGTVLAKGRAEVEQMGSEPCAIAAVDAKRQARFDRAVKRAGLTVKEIGKVEARNIGNGRLLDVTVFSVSGESD